MSSLYLDTASGEASQCCQQILLFSAGRFPRSSCLMLPLQKSSSRTCSKLAEHPDSQSTGTSTSGPGTTRDVQSGAEHPTEPGTGTGLRPFGFGKGLILLHGNDSLELV